MSKATRPPNTFLARLLVLLAPLMGACAEAQPYLLPPSLQPPFTGYTSPRYQHASMWACRPDNPSSVCERDRTATEIGPNGKRTLVQPITAKDPAIDCFYVYPTVDLSLRAGNHEDFKDIEPVKNTTFAQAAAFREVCAVYAPLYRQATIGSFLSRASKREHNLNVAFSDVADAFAHYMANDNHGRKVVLIGHSQGAEMVVRLLQRFFDSDSALRGQLLVGMPIGGHVAVKPNTTTGGTFQNIPLCTSIDELGCVVAYRSYKATSEEMDPATRDLPPEGKISACTNPADMLYNTRKNLSRSFVPATEKLKRMYPGLSDINTPMILIRDYYSAQCKVGPEGFRYLAIWPSEQANDTRSQWFQLKEFALNTRMGLHLLDFQLPQGELIELVRLRAEKARLIFPHSRGNTPSK